MQEKTTSNQGVGDSNIDSSTDPKLDSSTLTESAVLLESVSALMDGETTELELHRILKALGDNSTAGAQAIGNKWSRYHLVSASLKQEVHGNPRVNLLAGINAKLAEDDQIPSVPYQRKINGLLRKLGQTAVAASVAFTVLYGATQVEMTLRDQNEAGSGTSNMVANSNTALPEFGGDYTASALTRTVSVDAAARDRIRRAVQQYSGAPLAPFGGEAYTFPVQQVPAEPATATE